MGAASFLVQDRRADNLEAVSHPLTIWLIGDGKPGHENQSLGLAEAMARLRSCEVHRISLAGERGLWRRLRRAFALAKSLPRPDLIVAAGHATHGALLGLSLKYRAKCVVLMRPSLPLAWFDLCLAPEHDFTHESGRKNLMLTRGAINRVGEGAAGAQGKLVLIGGPSKTHGWDEAGMLDRLRRVCVGDAWELTDSRRTPAGFLDQLVKDLPQVRLFAHQETAPDWLPAKLNQAAEVWVTEDSVSMVYEALTSGARVGLLPVPRLREDSRVLAGLDLLVREGYLTTFDQWSANPQLPALPQPLREADRCAAFVLRLFFCEGES